MIQGKVLAFLALQIVLVTCESPTGQLQRTVSGGRCVFPFTYKSVVYKSCITKNHDRPWCSTTANYDRDNKWGNCAGYESSWVLTNCLTSMRMWNNCYWGRFCVFPFTYKGVVYHSCTTESHNRPWCSVTANYDDDSKWGDCTGYSMSSVNITGSNDRCAFPFTYKDVVYKSCTTKDHTRPWCSTTTNYDKDKKWGNCAGFAASGIKTTAGEYCVFPFTYKNVDYKSCTTKDSNRPWCSTTANYDHYNKSGNCTGFYSSGQNTTSGEYCAFPFIYRGVHYNSCTMSNHNRLWCSTTINYDKDKKWENCA